MSSSPPPPPPPSTTTAITTIIATPAAAAAADPSPPPSQPPPPRKFPAPCWNQDETLALISAYQDKWYSLRRRNLRTADWEAVAADVTRRCPPQPGSDPKTSAQCRHKMEKLRKRYRSEKQRFLSLPISHQQRFLSPSNWVFFDLMDSLETGSDPSSGNNQVPHNQNQILISPASNGFGVKREIKPDLEVPRDLHLKSKSGFVGSHQIGKVSTGSSKDELGKYFDEILMGMSGGGGGNGSGHGHGHGPIKFKVKKHPYNNYGGGEDEDEFDHDDDSGNYYDVNQNGVGGGSEYMMRGGGGRSGGPPPPGFKRMFPSEDYEERFDTSSSKRAMNGGSGKGGARVGRDSAVGEMVASIRMLGEGLVRMEKMKMEMMREIEKMRMDMEMKRSEMILESQQMIVNAFVEGLKSKNKKAKVMEVE